MSGRRRGPVLGVLVAVLAAVGGVTLVAPGAVASSGTTVLVPQALCATPRAGHLSCQAMKLVRTQVATTGARTAAAAAAAARPDVAGGPAGGYTPSELAKAYGLNVATATTQTVAIVDAFDDPTVKTNLAAFESHYRIAAETSTSFRVVNQRGAAAPLPAADAGWAGEITLDVQAVRGLCRTCKILLVEADSNSNADLALAVNRAVAMGAKIVSNSYGGPENDPANTASVVAAYNHTGVAMIASSGDDGWYGWDVSNDGVSSSDNVPSGPAVFPSVVGVGGTSLFLNPDSTRASETVWNTNGPSDAFGFTIGAALGAAGSGCSAKFAPQRWQRFVAGYSTLGCGSTLRSDVDIAAVADPFTGYDIFQTFGNATATCPATPVTCWETIGGTSLAAPVVAAMWGLAGGPAGVQSPALTLYGHYKHDTSRPTFDVTVGGTGLCDTATTTACFQAAGGNPNTIGNGLLDCAWASTGTAVLTNHAQCYAQPGYDGVSGVGTPKGLRTFAPLAPTAVISSPGTVTHNVTKRFSATRSTDPFPGGSITRYAWRWGDGTTSTGATPSHRYATRGTRTIALTVTDNYHRSASRTLRITVV